MNYLLEVGFTRDVWAHRIDIHAVIGRPMELDPATKGAWSPTSLGVGQSSTDSPLRFT